MATQQTKETKELKGFAIIDGTRKIHRFPVPIGQEKKDWLVLPMRHATIGPFGDIDWGGRNAPPIQSVTDDELAGMGRAGSAPRAAIGVHLAGGDDDGE